MKKDDGRGRQSKSSIDSRMQNWRERATIQKHHNKGFSLSNGTNAYKYLLHTEKKTLQTLQKQFILTGITTSKQVSVG